MKLTLAVLFLFCATAASAQYASVLNSQPVVIELPSHVEHASSQPLATPQNLLQRSMPTYAQGVQPLWEFPLMSDAIPLGDVAREFRKQHLLAQKAERVFSDQIH